MTVGLFQQVDEGDTTMADCQRMTARGAANKALALEHAGVLRESVAVMVREIMELEVARRVGAELGERAPDRRVMQRNWYPERSRKRRRERPTGRHGDAVLESGRVSRRQR
jgi:transposase-like protein